MCRTYRDGRLLQPLHRTRPLYFPPHRREGSQDYRTPTRYSLPSHWELGERRYMDYGLDSSSECAREREGEGGGFPTSHPPATGGGHRAFA
jgi:hypothetical protein